MNSKTCQGLAKIARLSAFLLLTSISFAGPQAHAEFFGDFPTGLLQLEKKEPYYLFVPSGYSPERTWPLLLVVGERAQDPKEVIEPWVNWAKEKEILVMAVPNLSPVGGVPDLSDQWLFEVKQEITERYRVDSTQILLVGVGEGGHYASYLGLKYPSEFTAAVLVGEAWAGPYQDLAHPSDTRGNQTPFYLAMDQTGAGFSQVEKKALELEKKGYHVTLEALKAGEDLAAFRDRLYQWFRNQSEQRVLAWEKPKRAGWWEKIKKAIAKFFEV
jgi:predicted esterase